METPVIGLGAGGHARVVIDALRLEGKYNIMGLLDRDPELIGSLLLGVPVLGTDDLLPQIAMEVHYFFLGLGSVGSVMPRIRLLDLALDHGLLPISVIHPHATVSSSATLGDGVTILAGAIINSAARIGRDCIINTGSIVEHGCSIGDHVHLATGARLCGDVCVGARCHVGAGAIILQGVNIGNDSIIGAGAVVLEDLPPGVTAVGVPARIIHQ